MAENQVQTKKPQNMREWLDSYQEKFMEAIPKNTIDVSRFITAASLEINSNPKLQKCDKVSIFQSLLESARYGLEVGKLLGQAWLIPYNDMKTMPDGSRAKVMTCHFQLGYKGLIVLARRSQTIKTIIAETVYENDIFEVELGQGRHLTHKIDIRTERGEPIAYYCLVELTNGGYQFSVLTKKDAEAHRNKYSKAATKEDNPWDSAFDEMAMKTSIIKTLKLCPISVEALEAVGRVERQEEMKNVTPSIEMLPPPPDQGEVVIEEPVQIIGIPEVQQEAPPVEEPKSKTAQKAIEAATKAAETMKIGSPAEKTFAKALEESRGRVKVAEFPAQKSADAFDIF